MGARRRSLRGGQVDTGHEADATPLRLTLGSGGKRDWVSPTLLPPCKLLVGILKIEHESHKAANIFPLDRISRLH